MEAMTIRETAAAVAGTIRTGRSEEVIGDVAIDSRSVRPGSLFVALPGERTDGHHYLGEAMAAGCRAALVTHCAEEMVEQAKQSGTALILVRDTERALQDLAAVYLAKFSVKRVGVTGSTGKTTTKEMLYHMLGERYRTICNQGNYNNCIGLPLSVFQVDARTEAAVFEMGMDRFGEIHALAEIVRPDIGLITNIGLSHVERLGSRENILRAKMELVDFFGSENLLVVNSDSDLLAELAAAPTAYRSKTVGHSRSADYRIAEATDGGEAGVRFRLVGEQGEGVYEIPTPGLHNVSNAALAIAAALDLGLTPEEIQAGLTKLEAMDKRLTIRASGSIKIIDDTYNASPDSMKAAIDVLCRMEGKRRIAILGDMFELGGESARYHREIGEYAAKVGLDGVITVGETASNITDGARAGGIRALHFATKEPIGGVLEQWIREGDVVLVKGSRGMAMEEIAAQVAALSCDRKDISR